MRSQCLFGSQTNLRIRRGAIEAPTPARRVEGCPLPQPKKISAREIPRLPVFSFSLQRTVGRAGDELADGFVFALAGGFDAAVEGEPAVEQHADAVGDG